MKKQITPEQNAILTIAEKVKYLENEIDEIRGRKTEIYWMDFVEEIIEILKINKSNKKDR